MVLRAVKDGDEPVPPRSISEAAASGTRLELLSAMRDRIAMTVQNPDCPPRDLAALTRRLDDISKQIEAIRAAERQESDRGEKQRGSDGRSFDSKAL